MNKFEIKTLLSSLSASFDIQDIFIKKHKNQSGIDIENCFLFFKHKKHLFVIWEKFKVSSSNTPDMEFSAKLLSTKMSLNNTIDFLDRTIFLDNIVTTGDPQKYIVQNIASALFDQLNSLSQLGLVNDKFKSYNVGLNFEYLKESVSKFDFNKYEFCEIYKSIILDHGFDCKNPDLSILNS